MSNARDDLKFAVEQIDHVFGTSYAKTHPELVAAFIHVEGTYAAAKLISDSLDSVAENVRSDHPLMGETFEGLRGALEEIASALSDQANSAQEAIERSKMNGEKDEPRTDGVVK